MIEEERNGLHEDLGREQRVWLEKLAAADRKSSGFQDMAAEGLITFDELRAKLAALEETREAARADEAPSPNHQVQAEPKAGRFGIDLGASIPAG